MRFSMRDIELHGVTVNAGKLVSPVVGWANCDPEAKLRSSWKVSLGVG